MCSHGARRGGRADDVQQPGRRGVPYAVIKNLRPAGRRPVREPWGADNDALRRIGGTADYGARPGNTGTTRAQGADNDALRSTRPRLGAADPWGADNDAPRRTRQPSE